MGIGVKPALTYPEFQAAAVQDRGHRALHEQRWLSLVYVAIDFVLVMATGLAVFVARVSQDGEVSGLGLYGNSLSPIEHLGVLLLMATLIILNLEAQGLYRTRTAIPVLDEIVGVAKSVLFSSLMLMAVIYVSNLKIISRLVVFCTAFLCIVTLSAWRSVRNVQVRRRAEAGLGARNVLIVGANKVGEGLRRHLAENFELGYRVVGFVDDSPNAPDVLGPVDSLPQIARQEFVDEIFVTIPSERELVTRIALYARQNKLNVKVVPELYDGLAFGAALHSIGGFPVMALHHEQIPEFGLALKRAFDVVCTATGLVFIAPLLALIALAIKLDSRGPIIYRSPRVGRKATQFHCLKFRTMVQNADALKAQLAHLNEREGHLFKISKDPRITRVGGFLRKYSLDELPQLWNVLKGDMSLVGPRPPLANEFTEYDLDHLRRLDVIPGITGLWQIHGRTDPSFSRAMALDSDYIENWSLWLDFKILVRTFGVVVKGTGQ